MDYKSKYLKYKQKYIELKRIQNGGAMNFKGLIDRKLVGKYKHIEYNNEENTLSIILNNDIPIKIKFLDDTPNRKPIFFVGDKHISPHYIKYTIFGKLDETIDSLDIENYSLLPYEDLPRDYKDFFPINPINRINEIKLKFSEPIVSDRNIKDTIIELETRYGKYIDTGTKLFNIIKSYLYHNGYILYSIHLPSIAIKEINDEIFEDIKQKVRTSLGEHYEITINVIKLKTVQEFINDLKSEEYVLKLSKLKPVATNPSGFKPVDFMYNWNLYTQQQKDRIINEMTDFLSQINGYEIQFRISTLRIIEKTSNPIIYYSENHLIRLSRLFNHHSLEETLDKLHHITKEPSQLDLVYIAFGDIDVTKLQKKEDLTDEGKRIYDEYMRMPN